MRKTLWLSLSALRGAILVLLLASTGSAFAQQWTYDEFTDLFRYWEIDADAKTLTIGLSPAYSNSGSYKSESPIENLEIPETVLWNDGEVYTIIGCGEAVDDTNNSDLHRHVFYEANNLKSVTFPATIKKIGHVFTDCKNLEHVEFAGENGLETISFPLYTSKLSSSNYPYEKISVTFPQSLKEIKNAFRIGELYEYFKHITFNVNDIEAWCTTQISGYDTRRYEQIDNVYEWSDEWTPTLGFVPITINFRGKEISSLSVPMGVESIKPFAFAGVNLSSVSIPEGVKEIGEGSFADTGLSSIELPESVKTIGGYAFCENPDLQNIALPAGLTALGDYVFSQDIALYEIEIPSGVKRIGSHTFDGCVDLETVTLNEGLEEIGEYAFYKNKRISEIKFPKSLVTIERFAFLKCPLMNIEFGDNLKMIGEYAFSRNPREWYDNDYYDYDDNYWNYWEEHKDDPTSKIKLGKSVESIGDNAFYGWNIRTISFPATLKEIGDMAFAYSRLTEVTLPESMTVVGTAFRNIKTLAKVSIPEGVEKIENSAFFRTSLRTINLPSSLKEIGSHAFETTNILNVVIPDAVTSIGANAFSSVNYLTLGSGITSISDPIAEKCVILKMASEIPPALGDKRLCFEPQVVIVPEGCGDKYRKNNRWKDYNIFAEGENKAVVNINKEVGEQLADQLVLQSRLMPAQVASLTVTGNLDADDWAVIRSNMTSLYELDLSNLKDTEIPESVLRDKKTLLSVKLPSTTKSIGDYAFDGCSLMHMSTIPEGLESIGAYAFSDCKSLDSEWVMPASLTSVSQSAFSGCESLGSIDFSATSIVSFPEEDDHYSEYWLKGVFENTYSLTSLILPPTLTRIGRQTFKNSGLKNIELPKGLKEIGDDAFNGSSIKGIQLPEGIDSIGNNAFGNSNLEGISLPASLRNIGTGVFANTPLVYAEFTGGLENIPNSVFSGCQDLMVVNLPTSLKSIGSDALAAPNLAAINAPVVDPAATSGNPFTGVDNMTCALSIPRQSFTKYLRAEYWGSFVGVRNNIDVTIPVNVEVTYIDEDDYQEMLEDMQEEAPEEPQSVRRRAMRVMRANNIVSEFKGYGKIFDGAALYRDEKGSTRFFIDLDPADLDYVKVEYNDIDITSQIDPETMSFVTAPLSMNSSLKIYYKGLTGVEEIKSTASMESPVDVYDLTGRLVLRGATDFSHLPAGIYIAGGKKVMVK